MIPASSLIEIMQQKKRKRKIKIKSSNNQSLIYSILLLFIIITLPSPSLITCLGVPSSKQTLGLLKMCMCAGSTSITGVIFLCFSSLAVVQFLASHIHRHYCKPQLTNIISCFLETEIPMFRVPLRVLQFCTPLN